MSEPLQARMRAELRKELKPCPTCGAQSGNLRALAKRTGVDLSTLWRFLGGKDARGCTLDRLDAYLAKRPR